jgi:4-cresol dehydrogenase (hydroxylating)
MTRAALPPGVSPAALDAALTAFASVVGDAFVQTSDDVLAAHEDEFHIGDPMRHTPSAVVLPDGVEEVRAIVRIAAEHRIPLWTVSTGRNLGYGASAPRVPGSVVLQLSRMNRILEVDEKLAYVLVEPGVRFFDLYDHLQREGIALWASVPGLGWGSVTGNALERGLGSTPYGDHSGQICGMEVVLADGDLLRTGMGALPDPKSWQLYKGGYGPSPEGLFLQSNFGVVTKLGMWLMPRPECFRVCDVKFAHESDLERMVEVLRPLRLDGTVEGQALAANALRAAQNLSHRDEWFERGAGFPEERMTEVMERFDVGWWNVRFGIYGREDIVELKHRIAHEAFGAVADARFASTLYPGDVVDEGLNPVHRLQAGIPNLDAFKITDWPGAPGRGAHLSFGPIAPMDGQEALRQSRMVRDRAAEYGFEYNGSFFFAPRYLSHIFIAQQYGFNDGAMGRFNARIKSALDPGGILSPGKQGIWPQGAPWSPEAHVPSGAAAG